MLEGSELGTNDVGGFLLLIFVYFPGKDRAVLQSIEWFYIRSFNEKKNIIMCYLAIIITLISWKACF